MGSLADAMKKVGLKATKGQNERPKIRQKDKKKTEVHQEQRNYCEICSCTMPDVEHYKHRNALIDARWICVACADKNDIHDQFRSSAQSDFSIAGKFHRYYGPTRPASEFKFKPGPNFRKNNGNR